MAPPSEKPHTSVVAQCLPPRFSILQFSIGKLREHTAKAWGSRGRQRQMHRHFETLKLVSALPSRTKLLCPSRFRVSWQPFPPSSPLLPVPGVCACFVLYLYLSQDYSAGVHDLDLSDRLTPRTIHRDGEFASPKLKKWVRKSRKAFPSERLVERQSNKPHESRRLLCASITMLDGFRTRSLHATVMNGSEDVKRRLWARVRARILSSISADVLKANISSFSLRERRIRAAWIDADMVVTIETSVLAPM